MITTHSYIMRRYNLRMAKTCLGSEEIFKNIVLLIVIVLVNVN